MRKGSMRRSISNRIPSQGEGQSPSSSRTAARSGCLRQRLARTAYTNFFDATRGDRGCGCLCGCRRRQRRGLSPTRSYAALQIDACDAIRTEGWLDRTLTGAVPCGLLGPRARAHAPIRSLVGLGQGRREALRVEASRWNRRQFFNGPSRRLMRIFADNPRR